MARKRVARILSTSTRQTKVAIYIRVSTVHQVDKDSIPMQKKRSHSVLSAYPWH